MLPEQAASLVTRQPFVLSVSSALLAQKHEQVGQVLHTSPLDTSQVLCTNPTLLTLSTTTLAHKLTLLRESVLAAQGAEQEAHIAQQQVHAAQGAESPVTSLSRSTRSVAQQHTGSLPGAEQQAGRAQAAGSEQGLQLSAALGGEQGQQEQQQQQQGGHQTPSTLASPSSHGQETTHPGTHFQLQNALPVSTPVYDHTHALKPALPTDSITTTTTTTTTTLAQDPYPHMQVAAVAGSNHAHSTSTTAAAPCNLPPLHTSTTQGADAHPALTASSTTNPSMATSDPSKPLDTSSITDANAYLALTASSTANPSTATSALSAPPQRSEVTGADARSELSTSSTTNLSAATSARSAPPQKSTTTDVNAHPTLTTSSTTNPSLASAWLTQLEALTPQQRAALACFSKERFARLPQLAGARAAALGRRRVQHHQLQQQQAHAQHAPNLQQQHVCAQPAVLTPGAPAHPSSANARKKNVRDREPARKGPARKKDMDGVSEGAAAERRYTLAAVLRMTEAKFRTALALEQAGCSEP
ncbi:hypothetical protein DUNSADRAFT_4192 [Dunaliella salina]|uniref:Uncharacterized protein n=1 Tax=Dunaliella salina TaxID=3046 RepID=A0ABQ7GSN5_DUNSA|nr:hypothetical protein DUNSADRAFT_4192 [Dunaliella salina]|eukprot:KAF5837555.1 hypothetical protein DUNSADRAFT_4192 [Dunaliella salina]